MKTDEAVRRVRAQLGPWLLNAYWKARRPEGVPDSWGCCYVACEVVRLLSSEDLRPATLRTGVGVHWFLVRQDGSVVDPTADQFAVTPDYRHGRRRGFLTLKPSKRARQLLEMVR